MTATTRSADLGARLLGGVGVALLLAAAISVVSARWEFFGPGARLGSLLMASGVLVVLTGQIRRLAPSTAQMLDVLVAAMVPIDTAAAAVATQTTGCTRRRSRAPTSAPPRASRNAGTLSQRWSGAGWSALTIASATGGGSSPQASSPRGSTLAHCRPVAASNRTAPAEYTSDRRSSPTPSRRSGEL